MFSEGSRYEYNLTPSSLVVDGGAYLGKWSEKMARQYNCHIWAFEPIYDHFKQAKELLAPFEGVHVFNAALGPHCKVDAFFKQGDSSGKYGSAQREFVLVTGAMLFFQQKIDVLKLNIEGGEYDFLEYLSHSVALGDIDNIQVQFHSVVPNWEQRYQELCKILSETHTETWGAGPTWENWKLK